MALVALNDPVQTNSYARKFSSILTSETRPDLNQALAYHCARWPGVGALNLASSGTSCSIQSCANSHQSVSVQCRAKEHTPDSVHCVGPSTTTTPEHKFSYYSQSNFI